MNSPKAANPPSANQPPSAAGEARFPPCPFLPAPRPGLDWRALQAFGAERGGSFYACCLDYAHDLWRRGLPARAVLALDRALFADLRGDEEVLRKHPLPYRSIRWMITHAPPEVFLGNPRVHYQHLADRVREPRREQRRWRAWACWHLVRCGRPELPPDPRHDVREPTAEEIAAGLQRHGIEREAEWWRAAVDEQGSA